jgi:hypothetical protein
VAKVSILRVSTCNLHFTKITHVCSINRKSFASLNVDTVMLLCTRFRAVKTDSTLALQVVSS